MIFAYNDHVENMTAQYQTSIDAIIDLIDRLTTGEPLPAPHWQENWNIPKDKPHCEFIIRYGAVVQTCIRTLIPETGPDFQYSKECNPGVVSNSTLRHIAFTHLLQRVHEQKTSALLKRLTSHWGIDPHTIIPTPTGIMFALEHIQPSRIHLYPTNPPIITTDILNDLTSYVRHHLRCFIKTTFTQGTSTPITSCEIPWPHILNLDPYTPIPNPLWEHLMFLGQPTHLTLNPPPTSPYGIDIQGNTINFLSNPTPPEIQMSLMRITTQRALILRECYLGPDITFHENVRAELHSTLAQSLAHNIPMRWCIARMHPALHDFCKKHLHMTTCWGTPACIPINFDPNNPGNALASHVYTQAPVWADPQPPSNLWQGTNPYVTKTNLTVTLHAQGFHRLESTKRLLESLAARECRCTLFIELPALAKDETLAQRKVRLESPYNPAIKISPIFELAPGTIEWTNQAGNSPYETTPSPTTLQKAAADKDHKQRWYYLPDKTLVGPTEDGRWDQHRSPLSCTLNRYRIRVYLYHHKDDAPKLPPSSIRNLVDTLSRISAPIPPHTHPDACIPYLLWENSHASLALRHHAPCQEENFDPYSRLRETLQDPVNLPPPPGIPLHPFLPLTHLQECELIPDPAIAQNLALYAECQGSPNPQDDAIRITAATTHAAGDLENVRFDAITQVAYLIGSPTNHLRNKHNLIDAMHTCEICKRLTTTLRIIKAHQKPPGPEIGNHKPPKRFESINELLETRANERVQNEISTRGASPRAKRATAHLRHTLDSHPIHACYICALPVMYDIRRYYFDEIGTDSELLHLDLKAHAQHGMHIALPLTHDRPPQPTPMWGTQIEHALIGETVRHPTKPNQVGTIISYDLSAQAPHQPTFFIHFRHTRPPSQQDSPETPPDKVPPSDLDACTEMPKKTLLGCLVNTQTTNPTWMGLDMTTWPPKNLHEIMDPLAPAHPDRLSWGIMPFLWDIAEIPRHPTWLFPRPQLHPDWNTWVSNAKDLLAKKDINPKLWNGVQQAQAYLAPAKQNACIIDIGASGQSLLVYLNKLLDRTQPISYMLTPGQSRAPPYEVIQPQRSIMSRPPLPVLMFHTFYPFQHICKHLKLAYNNGNGALVQTYNSTNAYDTDKPDLESINITISEYSSETHHIISFTRHPKSQSDQELKRVFEAIHSYFKPVDYPTLKYTSKLPPPHDLSHPRTRTKHKTHSPEQPKAHKRPTPNVTTDPKSPVSPLPQPPPPLMPMRAPPRSPSKQPPVSSPPKLQLPDLPHPTPPMIHQQTELSSKNTPQGE